MEGEHVFSVFVFEKILGHQPRSELENGLNRGVDRLFSPFDSICAYQARLDLAHCRFGDSIVLLHVKIQSAVYVSLF